MKVLKYTILFPIYYMVNPNDREGRTGVIIFNTVMAMVLLMAMGKSTQMGDGVNVLTGNSFTLNTNEERISNNKELALKILKEEYDIAKEEVPMDYSTGYSRISEPPLDKDLAMAKEYLSIVEHASNVTGVPKWMLVGISIMEGGSMYTKNPPVPGSSIPARLYGEDGLNFMTYGYEQVMEGRGDRASGFTDGPGVAGPYKIKLGAWDAYGADGNGDGVVDRYNLADASVGAGNMLNSIIKQLNDAGFDKGEKVNWIWATGAYNAGVGGMLARVPKDSLEQFLDQEIKTISNDTNLQMQVYSAYMETGRGWAMRIPILQFWDSMGWQMDQPLRDIVDSKVKNLNLQQEVGTSNPNGVWPGDLSGNRTENGYQTSKSSREVMHKDDENGNRMSMNMETLEYLVSAYSIGNIMIQELEYKVNNNTTNSVNTIELHKPSNIGTSLIYHWQMNGMENEPASVRETVEGSLGEVGWKGDFPIFIQKENGNANSRIDWKFNGRNTTLGKSGCSLYSLASMIHGAGLGNLTIPGTNKMPTIENLAKEFSNGPIIYTDVMRKGYSVSLRPTKTKDDLNKLYEDIKAGIPYIVNTRNGKIKGITLTGEVITTDFTGGGHFIIMVSGYEVGNKRYVEVIQTTRSNAGTRSMDQNAMAFDYDELINKNIMRSSAGHPVTAYTIIGKDNEDIAKYLTNTYVAPTTNSGEISVPNSITNNRRKNVIISKVENRNLLALEKDVRPGGDMTPNIPLRLVERALLVYEGTSAILYIDYNNAILITELEDTLIYEGVVEGGTVFGTTTDLTMYTYLVRTDEDTWVPIKEMKVTDD